MPNNSSTAKLSTKLSLDLQVELDHYAAMPVPSNLQTLHAVKEHVSSRVADLKDDSVKKKFHAEFEQLSFAHKHVSEKDALSAADNFFHLEDKMKKTLEMKEGAEIVLTKPRVLVIG
jgi:hypothetical protein